MRRAYGQTELIKALEPDLVKGKKANIGEIREWGGKKVQKTAQEWVEVKETGRKGGLEQKEDSKQKKKLNSKNLTLDAIKGLPIKPRQMVLSLANNFNNEKIKGMLNSNGSNLKEVFLSQFSIKEGQFPKLDLFLEAKQEELVNENDYEEANTDSEKRRRELEFKIPTSDN